MDHLKVPNNKYKNCPAQMADGRQFTDYRANTIINCDLMKKNDIRSSYNFRNYLTDNGNQVILNDRNLTTDIYSCEPCNADTINNVTVCKTDIVGQMCEPFDIHGLGRRSIAVDSKRVATVQQLDKKINEFDMFLETNLVNVAARPGLMCENCVIKN